MDEPVTLDTPTLDPITVLCVVAHPDDVDFGIAGTTTTLTAAGHRVVYCLVTSGQAGGSDPSVSRSDMATLREAEQRAAAEVVGVSELHFLGFPDGAVIASLELRKAIARVIRQVRPDRVITQSPIRILDRMYSSHPDHLATGEATLNAIYPDARNQFAFPELLNDEGLEPHAVPEVLAYCLTRTRYLCGHHRHGRLQDRGSALPPKPDVGARQDDSHDPTLGGGDCKSRGLPGWNTGRRLPLNRHRLRHNPAILAPSTCRIRCGAGASS